MEMFIVVADVFEIFCQINTKDERIFPSREFSKYVV